MLGSQSQTKEQKESVEWLESGGNNEIVGQCSDINDTPSG